MPIEISNTLMSVSVVRVEGVSAADIKRINWSTNGNITIVRNGHVIGTFHNAGEYKADESGYSIANNSTANVVITVTTGGTLFLELTKTATYTTPLTGM